MTAGADIKLTPEGIALLQEELRELQDDKLPELHSIVQASAEAGDLTDNSEWEESKDELARAQQRSDELELVLKSAEPIVPGSTAGIATHGSRITVRANDGEEITWLVVDPIEVFVSEDRVSSESPVGQKLIGVTEGTTFGVETPAGDVSYTVIAVD